MKMHKYIPVYLMFFVTFLSAGEVNPLILSQERDALSLNGEWQILNGSADAPVWQKGIANKIDGWRSVTIPARNIVKLKDMGEGFDVKALDFVWVRRTFALDEAQASRDVVLRWGGVRFGATAWVNGHKVTEYAPIGPHAALIPSNVLKPGANDIVLKVAGWAGVPKSESGFPLIPVGGSTQFWGAKGPGIYDDIWLEFYENVYAKWVLALPQLKQKSVDFRIWTDGIEFQGDDLEIHITLKSADGSSVLSETSQVYSRLTPKASFFTLSCPLPVFNTWTPENPQLYRAEVQLKGDGGIYDKLSFHFGMRELGLDDGDFRLNEQPLWLRGSNLLSEWLPGNKLNNDIKSYLIDEARSMNLNCFRTHTRMPTTDWLNVADQHGMMILAETPLLYNHGDFEYTEAEYEIFHKHALDDTLGWITRVWNHPSIIMWVISNESSLDDVWEAGTLNAAVKSMDPSRLIMRTGEKHNGTDEILDVHTCFNMKRGADGSMIEQVKTIIDRMDPALAISNSEYMNRIGKPQRRLAGGDKPEAWPMIYAEFAMEHTEAMRRMRFDCVLPYMYIWWTKARWGDKSWRPDYATPFSAALHSSMSPVLASLHLFDRNFATGTTLKTKLSLINEKHTDVFAKLELYITPKNPSYIPKEDALEAAVYKDSKNVILKANSFDEIDIEMPVPGMEGTYYVAAVLRYEGDTPIVSQRELHAVDVERSLRPLSGKRVMLYGAPPRIYRWLEKAGATIVQSSDRSRLHADVALIWDNAKLFGQAFSQTRMLQNFVKDGGRVVVMGEKPWFWSHLLKIQLGYPEHRFADIAHAGRAFIYDGVEHPIFEDMPKNWFYRWNGGEGSMVRQIILPESELWPELKPMMWASNSDYAVLAHLPSGEGEYIISQLIMDGRITAESDHYDPVAERFLANLLAK